jgi:hypothetical protein
MEKIAGDRMSCSWAGEIISDSEFREIPLTIVGIQK